MKIVHSRVPTDWRLDVCEVVETPTRNTYVMCLLAYAGYHAQKEMLDLLLEEGAGKLAQFCAVE